MFVHGEQADTILASLLALMASLQSLSRCLVVRLSLVQHALSSSPSLIKSLLVLLSYTAHPKPVRGKYCLRLKVALVQLKCLFTSRKTE